MAIEITATEVARNFSSVLDQVDRERREFVVRRGGKIVATITPPGPRSMTVGEVFEILRNAPRPDDDYLRDVIEARHALPPLTVEDAWEES